ncbi:hypothetical protein D0864_02098 [Hortaea werneckii]|uniref:F-box domain-containing protein n=1 Tax=Hortaea werneckii TaxID=91943 RepID=A0A3M7H0T5_HORWE|nr:hypothetical protein D0862_04455 [Hortaea werneckii]RMZ07002.1 hypothetical protein D0864_02098 [Hortaea werneckii]
MLTQTLPTLRTSHPTEPPPVSNHHHPPAATYTTCRPTVPSLSSLTHSPPSSTSSTPPTSDPTIPHLPPELWLRIFPPILSSPEELTNLHRVCRAFHSLLTRHEASLVREVLRTQRVRLSFLPGHWAKGQGGQEQRRERARERQGEEQGSEGGSVKGDGREGNGVPLLAIRRLVYPSPSPSSFSDSSSPSSSTFSDLWTLYRRLRSWEECEEVWRRCVSWGPEFAWARDRWEGVHFGGMVELARLGDVVGSGCSGIKGEPLFQDGRDEHAHGHGHGEGTASHYQPTTPPFSSPASSSAWRRTAEPLPFPSLAAIANPASSSPQPASLTPALERHTTRLAHLLSLPATRLALILFKLHTALRILRVLGPPPLRTASIPSPHRRPWDSTMPREVEMEEVWHDGNGAGLTRCEVEVAAEE